jgi:hypothetical protein
MDGTESIAGYMAYIQSHLMLEMNKKEDANEREKDKTGKTKKVNFEKFVLQVFVKGFDTFMNNPVFEFVNASLEKQINGGSKQEEADKLNRLEGEIKAYIHLKKSSIDSEKNAHIAFYTFCKLLNASHLSALRNEIIKYQSAQDTKRYKYLLAIIELCMLSVDVVPNDYKKYYTDKANYHDRLKPYIEEGGKIETWDDLYVQSDGQTPVIHGQVELAFKYGTENLLKEIIGKSDTFRIKKENFDKWKAMREERGGKKLIEGFIESRDSLHNQWLEEQNKRGFIEKRGGEYQDLCQAIDKYNWLDNKLHFVHLKDMHNLTVEILGRMAGFTALFERDFQYICQNGKVNEQMPGLKDLKFGKGLPQLNEDQTKVLAKIILSSNYRKVRNCIAHFNYLTTTGKDYSIIDLLNELRNLFWYDRKLKNAVSKSIIDLFDRHGMILKLKFDAACHCLIVEDITPKKIMHLGGGKIKTGLDEKGKEIKEVITTNQVHPVYCKICKTLLEYKKAEKK